VLLVGGCSAQSSQEGFAIYLLKDNIPVSQMPALSHFDLAAEPLISIGDIVSYDRNSHRIELTTEACQRVAQLQVPVGGTAFVVCVDTHPIYWGAFWSGFSSMSFDGVTIRVDLVAEAQNIIYLGLGYPTPYFFKGADPRSNQQIMQSLEKAGKLK
ncbi:MAG: hypothetical protein ACYDG5_06480, partial [Dehalococcoidales bacterium]